MDDRHDSALTRLHQRGLKAPFIFFLRFNPGKGRQASARGLDQRLRAVADRVNEIRSLRDFKGLRRDVHMVEYYRFYHSKCAT